MPWQLQGPLAASRLCKQEVAKSITKDSAEQDTHVRQYAAKEHHASLALSIARSWLAHACMLLSMYGPVCTYRMGQMDATTVSSNLVTYVFKVVLQNPFLLRGSVGSHIHKFQLQAITKGCADQIDQLFFGR